MMNISLLNIADSSSNNSIFFALVISLSACNFCISGIALPMELMYCFVVDIYFKKEVLPKMKLFYDGVKQEALCFTITREEIPSFAAEYINVKKEVFPKMKHYFTV